jgi:FkbM family methyltransferase
MSLLGAKIAGKKLFNAFGLDIRKRRHEDEVPRASMRGALRQLAGLGFRPGTVIDAGVAYQTDELYETFPDSNILLIEPLAEFEPSLRKICAAHKAQYVLAAAGATPGTATFNVHTDQLDGSSFLKEVEGAAVDGTPRQVPVVTIDQVCSEKKLKGPYLIKLDVQGAELQVLAGAQRVLEETEAVVVEVSLIAALIGGPEFYDIVARMKELGFVVYDMWSILYRPMDNALSQADMVFVREHGRFRTTRAFATPEQRKAQAWKPDPRLATPGAKKEGTFPG